MRRPTPLRARCPGGCSCPPGWDGAEATGRRARCRILEEERHRPKWQLALDMLDEVSAVGLRPAVLVADTGYGADADFRHGLEDRGLAYAVQVKSEMTAHAETAEPYQPPYGGARAQTVASLPDPSGQPARARPGRRPCPSGRGHLAQRLEDSDVRPVRVPACPPGRPPPEAGSGWCHRTAVADRPVARRRERTGQELGLRPAADIPARDLVRLAKLRWRIEHDYRELKTTLGLDRFEGRSFTGRHRHVAPRCGSSRRLFGCSPATVCRVIHRPLPAIEPTTRPADAVERLWIVDGTLIPVRDRKVGASSRNYRSSANAQVVIDADTKLVIATAPPVPGDTADAKAWRDSGLATICQDVTVPADGALTPTPASSSRTGNDPAARSCPARKRTTPNIDACGPAWNMPSPA
jgi:hypothetical protein